ncbi:MAG: hypothetical protein HOG03_00165 [Desulfobacula sp.]|jgi:misacylated tRNA(Ala) deacylase|uniref:hypothetical protein n=1 Tax=Desulfobacula sp. TaxID=2593537 RepID=UPI001DD8F35B|nr:hypothetical protein [Desulfobacula sp.]MBT3483802.1 hypothetical protein [Desulfobacula sp.]MBT3802990.1 hypothetical protein [Desulfobacula sp.]MBT4023497.1 hypothetical protein [Desulfobacula sp.]MBT4197038.1 hypothetical protein [Desulfobacula sp.]
MSKKHYPEMHTAEHMLNQAMVSKFGCNRCFSAHINKKKSKCDYHFERALTSLEIIELNDSINRQIKKDLPIIIKMVSKEDAQRRYKIDRVPDQEALKQIRIVSIGDYDVCPCAGLHVNSTREIGQFKITTTGFEGGVLRIRFKLL